jgi:nucleotide-binding universal stress UspA family protein
VDRIVACVDRTAVTERVLRQAAHLAAKLDAELFVLHVAPAEPEWVGHAPGPPSVRAYTAAELREAHRATQRLGDALRRGGLTRVTALTVQGPTVETIVEQAERLGADLLVLGAHHHGLIERLFIGSVARQVLRRTPCPVLIVPEPRTKS